MLLWGHWNILALKKPLKLASEPKFQAVCSKKSHIFHWFLLKIFFVYETVWDFWAKKIPMVGKNIHNYISEKKIAQNELFWKPEISKWPVEEFSKNVLLVNLYFFNKELKIWGQVNFMECVCMGHWNLLDLENLF